MSKEIRYQNEAQAFIERQLEARSGAATPMYTEEWSVEFEDVLQGGVSPLIRDVSSRPALARYGITGLAQKLLEFNELHIIEFIKKNKLAISVSDVVTLMFEDFNKKHRSARSADEFFTLIFVPDHELGAADEKWRRHVHVDGAPAPLAYNVFYYEKPGAWRGKNAFFTIRERRIPISNGRTQRPDFLTYVNGIPLLMTEYKTEDSGIKKAYDDFENKESYHCVPFKVAVADGRTLTLFSSVASLKHTEDKHNAFDWVHYDNKTRQHYPGGREFTNAEYFYDELLCQPQNLYLYCMSGCSATKHGEKSYLINARIQQYFALKDITQALLQANSGHLELPFNYFFSHAQRSGKTITMKLLCYLIAREYANLYSTVFVYTPDLQIKSVLWTEFAKTSHSLAKVSVIETQKEYVAAIKSLMDNADTKSSFHVYIVNTQKLVGLDESPAFRVLSNRVLNVIDEAHHGQAKQLAVLRDKIFPNASNYLFTATGKEGMYAHYFPDNATEGFQSKFTITDALNCGITVRVSYLKAAKTFNMSEKLETFSNELEYRTSANRDHEAEVYDLPAQGPLQNFATRQIRNEISKQLAIETMPDKLGYLCAFLDSIRVGLPFPPKGILYVNGVQEAMACIRYIQAQSGTNDFGGYTFGTDFAALTPESCPQYNPGLADSAAVERAFQCPRNQATEGTSVIDVLIAVDKYQKGFDLAELMVTFLDTSIMEPARMNQIYTRTATRRTGKNQGFCVDLTLDSRNDETFKQSMAMYDSADAANCFIDEDVLDAVSAELRAGFDLLMSALELKPTEFMSNLILNSVLNEPNEAIRKRRQEVFFRTSRDVFVALAKIGSPLYYRPFALELQALSLAFVAFKEIYADSTSLDNPKILISLETEGSGGAYFSSSEIKRIISDVLTFVDASNMKSLLQFRYVSNKHAVVDADTEHEQLVQKLREAKKAEDLKKSFTSISAALHASHKSLHAQIREMLLRIANDRTLVHDKDMTEQLTKVQAALNAAKAELDTKIAAEFGGNALLYWLSLGCTDLFAERGAPAPVFCSSVARQLEGFLHTYMVRLDNHQAVSERVQQCVKAVREKLGNRFASFYSGYSDPVESPELNKTLVALAATARAAGVKSFINDEAVFTEYLKQALGTYLTTTETSP